MKLSNSCNKNKYDFTFLYDNVKKWEGEVTMSKLNMLPTTICFFTYPFFDKGGNEIYDLDDYRKEREKYIEYLYRHFNK